jgi:hypothetical protein
MITERSEATYRKPDRQCGDNRDSRSLPPRCQPSVPVLPHRVHGPGLNPLPKTKGSSPSRIPPSSSRVPAHHMKKTTAASAVPSMCVHIPDISLHFSCSNERWVRSMRPTSSRRTAPCLLDSLPNTVIESCQRPSDVEEFPRRSRQDGFSSIRVWASPSRRRNSYLVWYQEGKRDTELEHPADTEKAPSR